MGGDGQAQIHLQVYTAVLRFGLNIQAALELPRWIHGADAHEERLVVENRFPPATLETLRQLGHNVEETIGWSSGMGHAHGILFDPLTGVMQGGSDPRSEGIAAGW
jgi:gamma-glutamyltranspeptidase/glutathione hydrolase